MILRKVELKDIVNEGVKRQLEQENRSLRYLENNGLELCADWLEGEIVRKKLDLSHEEQKKCIDYMVEVFYERVDKILLNEKEI